MDWERYFEPCHPGDCVSIAAVIALIVIAGLTRNPFMLVSPEIWILNQVQNDASGEHSLLRS